MLLNSCLTRPSGQNLRSLNARNIVKGSRGLLHCLAVAGVYLGMSMHAAALPQAAAPIFSIAAGSYPNAQSVTITDSAPAR